MWSSNTLSSAHWKAACTAPINVGPPAAVSPITYPVAPLPGLHPQPLHQVPGGRLDCLLRCAFTGHRMQAAPENGVTLREEVSFNQEHSTKERAHLGAVSTCTPPAGRVKGLWAALAQMPSSPPHRLPESLGCSHAPPLGSPGPWASWPHSYHPTSLLSVDISRYQAPPHPLPHPSCLPLLAESISEHRELRNGRGQDRPSPCHPL